MPENREKFTISVTGEDGHRFVGATLDTCDEPTPQVLSSLLLKAAMLVDEENVRTLAAFIAVGKE